MAMRQPIEDVERPLALFIMAVFLGMVVFFGIRYFSKVREAAKREEVYQSTLRSYRQIVKPGMKRRDVEEYLRSKNIEFFRLPDDDLTKIGEDDSLSLFCGRPDVFLQFQFTASPQQGHQIDGDDKVTLNKIEIIRKGSGCI
jgi:hypothetical protein